MNAKAVTVLIGHSSIQITFDRYGHLFPGHEEEAPERLDEYMAAAVSKVVTNDA
jgi:integrase